MELFGRELTTDEVIQFVRAEAPDARDLLGCHDCTILTAALTLADALEAERRAAPENKPLTLEQLRQMDEEPVWVGEKDKRSRIGHYGLVDTVRERVIFNRSTYTTFKAVAGKTAYARRPENTT